MGKIRGQEDYNMGKVRIIKRIRTLKYIALNLSARGLEHCQESDVLF